MKRGYFVEEVGVGWGFPVVAHTAKEAKRLVWCEHRWQFDGGWIDVSVRWVRDAVVDDLPFGLVESDGVALEHKLIEYLYY